jgi:hypothetical protein
MQDVPLIPLRVLFGNPVYSSAKVDTIETLMLDCAIQSAILLTFSTSGTGCSCGDLFRPLCCSDQFRTAG